MSLTRKKLISTLVKYYFRVPLYNFSHLGSFFFSFCYSTFSKKKKEKKVNLFYLTLFLSKEILSFFLLHPFGSSVCKKKLSPSKGKRLSFLDPKRSKTLEYVCTILKAVRALRFYVSLKYQKPKTKTKTLWDFQTSSTTYIYMYMPPYNNNLCVHFHPHQLNL